MSGPALTDVPDRYDVVFQLADGSTYGFLLADSVESNLPFRTHKALYSYSPTFLERQNVSQTYGDNFQDFFLTGVQADFSEGEYQQYFRVANPDSQARYWSGQNIDPTTVPGKVTLTQKSASITTTSALTWNGASQLLGWDFLGAGSTTLYQVSSGVVTSLGAHGLGAGTNPAIAVDPNSVYLSAEGGSSVGIRKFAGASFSTFSSTTCSALVFNDNILFGIQTATDSLISFDTAGNATTQFQWKGADGTGNSSAFIQMVPYGGQLYILRALQDGELWQYDGSGCSKLADLPVDFKATGLCVAQGIVFIFGYTTQNSGGATTYKPQVYYFANGSVGKLWESPAYTTNIPANSRPTFTPVIAPFGNGVAFQDTSNLNILQYDMGLGGMHTIANPGVLVNITSSNQASSLLLGGASTTSYIYPPAALTYNSSGFLETSLYDFDNTLQKVFRGLKFDATIPANTTIDIAYQLDGLDGAYTTLQTGASTGTEYLLPASTIGSSISLKLTLNSASASATPTLRRVYVRAAPLLQQFRRREFLFNLSSGTRDEIGKVSQRCRDGSPYPVDALTACLNLAKVATQITPFTVADRFTGSTGMTVLADLEQNQEGYDGFAIYEIRPNIFIGRINVREV